ncbi:BTB domain-containing protein [Favolaschia claudopus]|uniref:BTB domain-containing protein n=1 Tax=Favolaschia claudopus TaxID=2862362 RepID=A0AAW0B7D4_9AGAR
MEEKTFERGRDETYYFDDGDCMFLVDGVLFKLHKAFLNRDPESMFFGMLNIPQPKILDAEPVKLTDDSAEEFRALCWVLYALPDAIHIQATANAEIPKLLKIAKICHKYTLAKIETWALDMLKIQCKPAEGSPGCLAACSEDLLVEIMTRAFDANHIPLRHIIEETWLSRLDAGEISYRTTLTAGEMQGWIKFSTRVYTRLNKKLSGTRLPTANPFSHLDLTDGQLLRLLSGSMLLSNFWSHFRRNLPREDECTDHPWNCLAPWNRLAWSDSSDIWAGLHAAYKAIGTEHRDRCTGLYINQTLRTFSVTLVESFFGPQS